MGCQSKNRVWREIAQQAQPTKSFFNLQPEIVQKNARLYTDSNIWIPWIFAQTYNIRNVKHWITILNM